MGIVALKSETEVWNQNPKTCKNNQHFLLSEHGFDAAQIYTHSLDCLKEKVKYVYRYFKSTEEQKKFKVVFFFWIQQS